MRYHIRGTTENASAISTSFSTGTDDAFRASIIAQAFEILADLVVEQVCNLPLVSEP